MKKSILFAFAVLMLACSPSIPENPKVGIVKIGPFEDALVDSVEQMILANYGFDRAETIEIDLPKFAFVNIKSPRYRADSLIFHLKNNKPDTIDFWVGLTQQDISCTKKDILGNIKKPASKYKDWGIFGLAYRPGPSCVVSSYRLKKGVSRAHYIQRLKKVCNHELGHNLGLKHCTDDKNCVMQDAAETIKTIDRVSNELCSFCKAKLK